MNTFTEKEIKEIESLEDLQDMVTVLDSILDGEVFRIRNTDTDTTMNENLKPVLPKGLVTAEKVENKNSKRVYAYILQVLIALIIDLNPNNDINEDDYVFRIAIIINAITSGCLVENRNWKKADITFDDNFVKKEGKKYYAKNKELVQKVKAQLNAANTFLAFSAMNMVRFNHHFPIEKINLITKSLANMPDAQKERLLEEEKLETFYDYLVTAARIVNDKKMYEKYILKIETGINNYYYYSVLGAYDINFEEEIIKIRSVNTPNGFLILDIINEIYNDIKNKKLLFAIPYQKELAGLLQIRNHIRKNPFGYHPARNFYKCVAKDYDNVVGSFQNYMKKVGSFIYQYSEEMYESVRSAKCRIKYEKNITKDDEMLVKLLNSASKVDVTINQEKMDMIKKKLFITEIKIDENTDIVKINKELADDIEKVANSNLSF